MVGIVLLFGRTVGVGAGGERWQGDRGTDIAVASPSILSPDQAVGISHPEFCWWSRSRFKGATVILSSPTFSRADLLYLLLRPLKHRSRCAHQSSGSKSGYYVIIRFTHADPFRVVQCQPTVQSTCVFHHLGNCDRHQADSHRGRHMHRKRDRRPWSVHNRCFYALL